MLEVKIMKKRIITAAALLLFLSLVFLAAASCGAGGGDTGGGAPGQQGGEETGGEAVPGVISGGEDAAPAKILPNLPDTSFGGHVFNIMISGNMGADEHANIFFFDGFSIGDIIPEAIIDRNRSVEERFDITIATTVTGDNSSGQNAFRRSVQSQDFAYDAAILGAYAASGLASEGMLADLNAVSWLDFEKPWWDQKAVQDLTILNRLFYMTGDFNTINNDWTYAILFNKELADDYELECLYEHVRNGTWTVDKFGEYTKRVSVNLSGGDRMGRDDRFGALIWDDSMMGIINAAGERCAIINADGEIELTLFSERTLSMFNKYTEIVFDRSVAFAYQRVGEVSGEMFANNQALFDVKTLYEVSNQRGMEIDFGILPYFKYDEAQENYYHTVGSFHSVFLAVPMNQGGTDLERTGAILEALAAESHYTVRPAYYDRSLIGKHARDEESTEMLDIIFAARVYDVGWFYQFGNYNEEIMNLFRRYSSNFVSMFDIREAAAQRVIDRINGMFAEVLG
jgi:hypothetical protein